MESHREILVTRETVKVESASDTFTWSQRSAGIRSGAGAAVATAFGVAFVAGEGEAAGSYGAEVIYSKDLADGQSYGDVRVIHPLK